MFILIDNDFGGLTPFIQQITESDDRPVHGIESLDSYEPNGKFHIVDHMRTIHKTRWHQLRLATLGARVFSDSFDTTSPIYAGPIPESDKLRKISVDGAFAEGRAGLFGQYGVNYIGRTKLTPRNIFVLDNKKGNPLHDPSKDEALEALYDSLPEDWWGSCGFVSTGNVDKLEKFFYDFPDLIPLAYTTGAFSKLKYLGLEYVDAGVPDGTEKYGIVIRDRANRLSYKLSEPEELEKPAETGWLQL